MTACVIPFDMHTVPGPVTGDPVVDMQEFSRADAVQGTVHALPEGMRLLDYEIVGPIGEGGFGIVYLAWDHALEQHVAIKEYLPAVLASRASVSPAVIVKSQRHMDSFRVGMRSFVNEARVLARFDHPALVRVLRFWEGNGTAYMAMPYYAGPTLSTALAELGRPPDEAELLGWLRPLLDGLGTMHAVNFFHRDIAPDNILLTDNGPVLIDFGAARRVIEGTGHAPTVVFKPGFAPIEQYGEVASMKQGAWTDLYALASVVYAAITGQPPTPSIERLMGDPLRPLAEVAAGRYSENFLAAIDQALALHPRNRPQTAAVLWARLSGEPLAPEDEERPHDPVTEVVPAESPRTLPPVGDVTVPDAAPIEMPDAQPMAKTDAKSITEPAPKVAAKSAPVSRPVPLAMPKPAPKVVAPRIEPPVLPIDPFSFAAAPLPQKLGAAPSRSGARLKVGAIAAAALVVIAGTIAFLRVGEPVVVTPPLASTTRMPAPAPVPAKPVTATPAPVAPQPVARSEPQSAPQPAPRPAPQPVVVAAPVKTPEPVPTPSAIEPSPIEAALALQPRPARAEPPSVPADPTPAPVAAPSNAEPVRKPETRVAVESTAPARREARNPPVDPAVREQRAREQQAREQARAEARAEAREAQRAQQREQREQQEQREQLARQAAAARTAAAATPSSRPAACTDILQRASLGPITAADAAYLRKECE